MTYRKKGWLVSIIRLALMLAVVVLLDVGLLCREAFCTSAFYNTACAAIVTVLFVLMAPIMLIRLFDTLVLDESGIRRGKDSLRWSEIESLTLSKIERTRDEIPVLIVCARGFDSLHVEGDFLRFEEIVREIERRTGLKAVVRERA